MKPRFHAHATAALIGLLVVSSTVLVGCINDDAAVEELKEEQARLRQNQKSLEKRLSLRRP